MDELDKRRFAVQLVHFVLHDQHFYAALTGLRVWFEHDLGHEGLVYLKTFQLSFEALARLDFVDMRQRLPQYLEY